MFIPMSIANMPAGNITIDLGLKGESISIVTACASSTHAIGEAYKTIKYGAEDVILAGGAEASICGMGIAGFENMKALCTASDKNRAHPFGCALYNNIYSIVMCFFSSTTGFASILQRHF